MMKRKEVDQLLSLYADLLDSVESLQNNIYGTDESIDEDEAYRDIKALKNDIIDVGNIAKEMDDVLLAKELRSGTKEDEE